MAPLSFLNDATFAVQLHLVSACFCLVLAPLAILRRSRDKWHRRLGKLWVGLMAITAMSAFFITEIRMIGPFSPIHLLSVVTLIGLFNGVRHARAGRIREHERQMKTLYFLALILAGLFTFYPGRLLARSLVPDMSVAMFWGVVAAFAVAYVLSRPWRIPDTADKVGKRQ